MTFLIYSKLPETWCYSDQIIFSNLQSYETFSKLDSNSEYKIYPAYGLDRKHNDLNEVNKIEKILLLRLYPLLNDYHNLSYSNIEWNIIIQHWLRDFIRHSFFKIKKFESIFVDYENVEIKIIEDESYRLCATNYKSAFALFSDIYWNAVFDGKVIKLLKNKNLTSVKKNTQNNYKLSSNNTIKLLMNKLINYWSSIFSVKRYFFIDSYLPYFFELKVRFLLGDFFSQYKPIQFPINSQPSSSIRHSLTKKIVRNTDDFYVKVISNLLFELMPISYLEGFGFIDNMVSRSSWPQTPNYVITANRFHFDDFFKIWAARRKSNGCKLIFLQHGGCYGTSAFQNPTIEECLADKFVTWGWGDGRNYLKGFIVKFPYPKSLKNNLTGGTVFFLPYCEEQIQTWDCYSAYDEMFKMHRLFYSQLTSDIQNNLYLKFHSDHNIDGFNAFKKWSEFAPNIKYFSTKTNMRKCLSKTRIAIYGYDSTGLLECLSQNIPVMSLVGNIAENISPNAREFYYLLQKVGIVYEDPVSMALQLNKNYESIDEWWSRNQVQEARVKFCNEFARVLPRSDFFFKDLFYDRC